jgi:hypothetical protein
MQRRRVGSLLIRSLRLKKTSKTANIKENKDKKEESAGPVSRRDSRKDMGKKILLVIVVVVAWLVVKRFVISAGNENLMILVLIAAAALVLGVIQRMKW